MLQYTLYKRQKLLMVFIAVFSCTIVFSQANITGAKCVTTGLVYQYDIKGEWKENDKINICVDGGVIAETNTACTEKQIVSFVRVQWSDGKTTGKITVTSRAGTSSISVNIAPSFNPGVIQAIEKQTITFAKTPASLSCTQATGGTCSPEFSYQWEESSNRVQWKEIPGATGRNLAFIVPLRQSTFFRRKVVETKSKTVGYTNTIAVFVIPQKVKSL